MGGSNSVQPPVRPAKMTCGKKSSSSSAYKMDIGYSVQTQVRTANNTYGANTFSSSTYKTGSGSSVRPKATYEFSSSTYKMGSGNTPKATPVEKRLFGFFHCKLCRQSWQSGNSWPNTGQKCRKCHTMVLPFKQQPLEQSEGGSDNKVQHPRELCGKCIQLGRPCNERYFR